ncbi:phosphotransferase [Rhodococcus globerulus]|uniref:phosphotransferase n=1 Tax=Rhodococcus globerulus TaxID=33008 RepID=UPI0005A7A975|nr:phosphotransferase [Rhodococcus globerulus]MCE4266308.1 phosphotransferase [Rhodococcus globerulus]
MIAPHEVQEINTVSEALRSHGSALPDARLLDLDMVSIGNGAMADTFLLKLTWSAPGDGPASVILKRPSTDSSAAATAASLGAYEREARFYTELAPRTEVRVPRLFGTLDHARGSTADTVLLEDLTEGFAPGDQFHETSLPRIEGARHQLALLQAPFWNDPETAGLPWLHRRLGVPIPGILERMERSWAAARSTILADLPADERACIDRFVRSAQGWAEKPIGPNSLVHHDFRVDNLLFGPNEVVAIDWQTIGWGPVMFDFAYLVGTSLEVESRRKLERDLVRRHVHDLQELGVTWNESDAWDAYRWAAFAVLLMLVPPISTVKSNPRMEAMFRRLLSLGARLAIDVDSLELLN